MIRAIQDITKQEEELRLKLLETFVQTKDSIITEANLNERQLPK
jgi:hypothetical protein